MPLIIPDDQQLIFMDGQWYLEEFVIAPETISFHEKTNRWITFYSYFPEWFCRIGTEMASFLRGELFVHDRDELNYNRFHDINALDDVTMSTFPSSVSVISNVSPSESKIYQSISQECSDVWDVEYLETENGQITRMPETAFTKGAEFSWQPGSGTKEYVHYANVPMDENSPGGIINGDRIRDYSVLAKFTFFKNKLTKLFAVNFNVTKSFKSE